MRIRDFWNRAKESMWLIPSGMTISAAALAIAVVSLDRNIIDAEWVREIWFVFDIGSDGAQATLSAIAQSVITVTGVVFSVTIIALQLTATQFTPRVLRTFLSDRSNQLVLGIFISTFTYTLLVVRTVGSGQDGDDAFVPRIAVTLSIVLTLVSVGALIYFINHIAQSIRASVIVNHVADDALRLIEKLFPSHLGEPAADGHPGVAPPEMPEEDAHPVLANTGGYLQFVDESAIFSLAKAGRAVIRMEPSMGRFMLPGEPLAHVWPDAAMRNALTFEELDSKIRAALSIGDEWTLQQDLERALVELSDIAVRALSPSLNDPTTATMCVDHFGEILTRLGNRETPSPHRVDETARIHFIAERFPWDRAVEVSFEKIRHYGERSPSVLIRIVEICGRVRLLVPHSRRAPLEVQIRLALETGRRGMEAETEIQRLEQAASRAMSGTDQTTGVG